MFWRKKPKNLGEQGELLAKNFLKKKGYKILETNFQNPTGRRLGEIDIIARHKGELVFIEVKSRVAEKLDLPVEAAITPQKLVKVNKIAHYYLRLNKAENEPYRFDAVSVHIEKVGNKAEIKHIPYIFF